MTAVTYADDPKGVAVAVYRAVIPRSERLIVLALACPVSGRGRERRRRRVTSVPPDASRTSPRSDRVRPRRGRDQGSFEVGVDLVGVEASSLTTTATSAGAIAATVLAQARTLPQFLRLPDEIEGDALAWTQTEHVFGKQAWALGALDGTFGSGLEIDQEITEGTRPPFPLTPSRVGRQRGGAG